MWPSRVLTADRCSHGVEGWQPSRESGSPSVYFQFRHAMSDPAAKDKAGARFKEVSEAYQVLSNDAKRAIYNREGRAGLRGGGNPRYQQYARYRGGGQSQYARYQYEQSFRARESGSWWRAPMRGFGRTDYIIHASIALLGLGAFLFIDQAGESLWKRHNTGKSFEELQAARHARSQPSPQGTSTKEETSSAPSRPPQLLVRRPNPGWPFHRVRQHDGSADAQNSNNVRGTRGVGEQDRHDGANSNISRGSLTGKTSDGLVSSSDSGQLLGDAARVALDRKVVAKPLEQADFMHALGVDKPVAKQRETPPRDSCRPSKIENVS